MVNIEMIIYIIIVVDLSILLTMFTTPRDILNGKEPFKG